MGARRRICLVGVGLIAGSLGLALREADPSLEVVGFGRDAKHLQKAIEKGAIEAAFTKPADALAHANMVVLGVPLGAVRQILAALAPYLAPETVLTDVGSAKGCVLDDVREVFGEIPTGFVPGHPIAGIEHSGVEAAFSSLFVGRRVILTPSVDTRPAAVDQVRSLWELAGAEVTTMSVDHHDRMLAVTSHLPHLLAYGLVDMLARSAEHEEILRYAAGGFRDFTRIASSDPVMWRDICLGNREALLACLADYRADLKQITALIEAADGEGLERVFENAKRTRDAHLQWFEG